MISQIMPTTAGYEDVFFEFSLKKATRLISNAEDGMMNEEKVALDFVRLVSFPHSAGFLLHCASE